MQLDIASLTDGLSGDPEWTLRVIHSGRRRKIWVPNQAGKEAGRNMVERLRSEGVTNPFAACRPGQSTMTNAARHRSSRFFVVYDLRHAYDGVVGARLAQTFSLPVSEVGQLMLDFEGQDELERYLSQFFLLPDGNGLRTGSPAAVDLFNWYCYNYLDFPLAVLCGKWNITYSRFVDDLVFSSPEPIGQRKRKAIRETIRRARFTISRHKSQVVQLVPPGEEPIVTAGRWTRSQSIVITGIGMEAGTGRLFMPRPKLRTIEGLLHRAITKGDIPEAVANGYWAYFRSIYPQGTPLNRSEQRISDLHLQWRRSLRRR